MKKLVALLVLVAGVASAAIPQTERDVLIALYNSTNGDSWTRNTNWKTNGNFSNAGTGAGSSASIRMTPLVANPEVRVYTANLGNNNVSALLAANGTAMVPNISVGATPVHLAVNPAHTRVYVANWSAGTVSVIDTGTNTVVSTITGIHNPEGVAVHPNGSRLYVTTSNGGSSVLVYDIIGVSPVYLTTIDVSASGDTIVDIAVNAAGTYAYSVGHLGVHKVAVIDLSTNLVVTTVQVGANAWNVAVSPDGTRVYVTTSNGLDTIDSTTPASSYLHHSLAVGVTSGTFNSYGVAISADASRVYVANTTSEAVYVLNAGTTAITSTFSGVSGAQGVAISPDGTKLYVTNGNSNTVSVVDSTAGTVLAAYVSGSNARNVIVFISATSPQTVTPVAALVITPLAPMTLSVVPNQSLQATGTVAVVANQRGTWTATISTPWLSLIQSIGAFPGVVAGIANAAGLAAGSYTGSISVAGTAPGGTQTISIPVTLTVNSPAALTANPTAISMASSYPAGSATGFSIQTGAPGLAFTASTSASSAGWLTVSPTSGIAPTPITVTLDPSKATPGIYTDSIVVSSPGVASVSIPVKMSVSGIIATLPQQVNAATQAGPDHTVAPNQLVTLYLTGFSCATAPVISINGTAVSWSSYVAGQINYAVPANITSPAALTVACNGTTAWTFNGLTTAAVVPGIFTISGTGKGQAAIVNSDGTTNSSTNPATRGTWLSVYGTGFGVFNAAGTNGLRTVAGNVTATIGGVDATVLYAGNTPGATDGLQQFNLQIPAGVTAGTAVPIVLTVNGTPTQTTATVSLQ